MFYCNGPITGYQLQAQIPLTGVQSPPLVDTLRAASPPPTRSRARWRKSPATRRTASARRSAGYETITGQFAIGTKLCAEPRVDPLLTVTYAYLEKSVVTQAISGPFDLGRPLGCKPDALSGGTRLNPKAPRRQAPQEGQEGQEERSDAEEEVAPTGGRRRA